MQHEAIQQCGIPKPGDAIYVRRTNIAQKWAQDADKNKIHLTLDTIPKEYQRHEKVFSEEEVLSPAPAPVERTTGGTGKSWEPAPEGDFRFCNFCQYVSPRVAHKSGRCDCMSSPSPFSPVR